MSGCFRLLLFRRLSTLTFVSLACLFAFVGRQLLRRLLLVHNLGSFLYLVDLILFAFFCLFRLVLWPVVSCRLIRVESHEFVCILLVLCGMLDVMLDEHCCQLRRMGHVWINRWRIHRFWLCWRFLMFYVQGFMRFDGFHLFVLVHWPVSFSVCIFLSLVCRYRIHSFISYVIVCFCGFWSSCMIVVCCTRLLKSVHLLPFLKKKLVHDTGAGIRVALRCCCFFPFSSVCFRLLSFACLRSCAGLRRLLLGSEVTIVFVGVACDELSGNKQMAHSQIIVVIVFSLVFEMDVALVLHGRPLGDVGFHCHLSIVVFP